MTSRPVYSPDDFALLEPFEERHFWFRSRRKVIEDVLAGVRFDSPAPRVADLGCGSGEMLPVLSRAVAGARVVGVDRFAEALAIARRRNDAALIRADVAALPLQPDFDLVCLLDVIEHLDEDAAAVAAARSLLKPGSLLLVTVPAHPWLWSEVDYEAGHRRRYRPGDLRRMVEGQHFEVNFCAQYMSLLVVPLAVKRLLIDRFRGRRGRAKRIERELSLPGAVNELAVALLGPERHLLRRGRRPPIGSSIVLLARAV